MKCARKIFLAILLSFLLTPLIDGVCDLGQNHPIVYAADVGITTDSETEIYNKYQDHSLDLYTDGLPEKLSDIMKKGKLPSVVFDMLKQLCWAFSKAMGQFTSKVASLWDSVTIEGIVKSLAIALTTALSSSMVKIASTVGLFFFLIVFITQFTQQARFGYLFSKVCLALMVFTAFAVVRTHGTQIVNTISDVNTNFEHSLLSATPKLKDDTFTTEDLTASGGKSVISDVLKQKMFINNVWVPYLLLQYGESDRNIINSQSIEIDGVSYSRIEALLDHQGDDDFIEKVLDYETEKLENKNISANKALGTAGLALLYSLTSLVQLAFLLIMLVVNNVLAVFLYLAVPVFPIILFFIFSMSNARPLGGYGMSLGILVVSKSSISFLVVFYSAILQYGFTANFGQNAIGRFFFILILILMPFVIYKFFPFFVGLFSGHPMQGINNMYQRAIVKEMRKEQRKQRAINKANAKDESNRRRMIDAEKRRKKEAAPDPNENLNLSGQQKKSADARKRADLGDITTQPNDIRENVIDLSEARQSPQTSNDESHPNESAKNQKSRSQNRRAKLDKAAGQNDQNAGELGKTETGEGIEQTETAKRQDSNTLANKAPNVKQSNKRQIPNQSNDTEKANNKPDKTQPEVKTKQNNVAEKDSATPHNHQEKRSPHRAPQVKKVDKNKGTEPLAKQPTEKMTAPKSTVNARKPQVTKQSISPKSPKKSQERQQHRIQPLTTKNQKSVRINEKVPPSKVNNVKTKAPQEQLINNRSRSVFERRASSPKPKGIKSSNINKNGHTAVNARTVKALFKRPSK